MMSATNEVDLIIGKLKDWRGEKMSTIRKIINDTDPRILEEVKWKKPSNPDGIPVWSIDGLICTGEIYKNHLRFTFGKGVILKEKFPNLFNAYRAILIRQEDKIDKDGFKKLIKEAVNLNLIKN